MLRQSKGKFLFKSEALLEEFIWLHLNSLLKLDKIKKQHIINKQNRSDILGVTASGKLAILELKKGGSKGSIEQLIRYKDNLVNERPSTPEFSKVDFSQGYLPIAIASNFSDNARTYAESKLPGCLLLTYEIQRTLSNESYLILKNSDDSILSKVKVEIIEDPLFESLPSFMQGYLLENPDTRGNILELIETILDYHPDIRFDSQVDYSEDVSKSLIFAKYNKKGKILNNKNCADFTYRYGNSYPNGQFRLTVYLPTITIYPRDYKVIKHVDGICVGTDDFVTVTRHWDLNSIFREVSNLPLRYPLKAPGINQVFDNFEDYYINYRKYMKSRQKLRPIQHSDFTTVKGMVRMALEDWSAR